MSNRHSIRIVLGVTVGLLAVQTALAQVAVRFDPFDPTATFTTTSTTTLTTSAYTQTVFTGPIYVAPIYSSTVFVGPLPLKTGAISEPSVSGGGGRPPVRDPLRPPTRSPFRP